MRTFGDRVRHAVLFELIGLLLFIPFGALLFGLPPGKLGVIGVVSATVATLWNFAYNIGFDHAMQHLVGHTRKKLGHRVVHVALFEIGLLVLLLPMIAWYLGISLLQALLMDLAFVVFYVAYAFAFNLAYDRIFPLPARPALRGARATTA
jgi:uncharacterized membrane protein